jgi:hypothetical protein
VARVIDISRGGIGLVHQCQDAIGTDVEITLPGDNTVKGRIARKMNGSIGVVFVQDKTSLAVIDRALGVIGKHAGMQAA